METTELMALRENRQGAFPQLPPRMQREVDDPERARAEAAEVLDETKLLEERLAELREAEALARQSLYQCEFLRLTRELAKSTQEREEAERHLSHARDRATAKLRRNCSPLIDLSWRAVQWRWHDERQRVDSNTSRGRMKKIQAACDALRAGMDEIRALEITPGDSLPKLKEIMRRLGVDMPTLPQPIIKTKAEADDE